MEYDEKTQLLTDIHSRVKDFEHGFVQEMIKKQEQQEKEKANAEEMRRMASEKLGETRQQKELDTPIRKRKSTEFVEYLKQKEKSNKRNTERQLNIREEELKLEKQKLDVQRRMQNQILEQLECNSNPKKRCLTCFKTLQISSSPNS